jgi:hypothetical protein
VTQQRCEAVGFDKDWSWILEFQIRDAVSDEPAVPNSSTGSLCNPERKDDFDTRAAKFVVASDSAGKTIDSRHWFDQSESAVHQVQQVALLLYIDG